RKKPVSTLGSGCSAESTVSPQSMPVGQLPAAVENGAQNEVHQPKPAPANRKSPHFSMEAQSLSLAQIFRQESVWLPKMSSQMKPFWQLSTSVSGLIVVMQAAPPATVPSVIQAPFQFMP